MGNNRLRFILYLLIFLFPIFCLLSPNFTFAQNKNSANLFFDAPRTQMRVGEKVTINVKIDATKESINAISGNISFPAGLVRVVSIGKEKSIIKLWTEEPRLSSGGISFEGIILNPGFQGTNGLVLQITLEAKKTGAVSVYFSEGSVLANDGFGTNVLASLGSTNFKIIPALADFSNNFAINNPPTSQLMILPVITEFSPELKPTEVLYLRGKGEPSALTKIIFQNLSVKSIGEKLIAFLQTKKEELGVVVVKNDSDGVFRYTSGPNLTAGAYNATPFLVNPEKNTETPGPSIQLLVKDSVIVKYLVVVLNVLALLIPVMLLLVILYFIPWYSYRKMRLMKERMLLEEEKIKLVEEDLKHKPDKLEG